MADEVLYELSDPVAIIRLNRPEKLNALTNPMMAGIREAVNRAAADPAVVGIIITGEGRGFCAGLDAQALTGFAQGGSASRPPGDPSEVPGLFTYLLAVPKPVIAAVNGVAAGGGMVLAIMSDLRFAAPEASFITSFAQRGLIAEHGTSWMLPRQLGPGRALDLLWSSRRVYCEEAARIGLVEYVTEADNLVESARAYVEQLAATVSPASLRDMKRLVYGHCGVGYPEALREADEFQWKAMDRPDALEGVRSFVERRPPSFPRLGAG